MIESSLFPDSVNSQIGAFDLETFKDTDWDRPNQSFARVYSLGFKFKIFKVI